VIYVEKKQTGDRGEYLALYELKRRGYTAFLKPTNHPVFDIECESCGGRRFTSQVKTSTLPELKRGPVSKTHSDLKEAWQKMPLRKPNGEPYKRTGHVAWQHIETHLAGWDKLPL
jgi:hypothetical protein